MLDTSSLSAATSRLSLPRASLSSCVRAIISRDTRGAELNAAQRFNHYPANPLCSITWWFHGASDLQRCAGAETPEALDALHVVPPRIIFSGPQTGPTISRDRGPVGMMMLLVTPDAMRLLTGIDVGAWVDRFGDIREALPEPWLKMCEDVRVCPDDAARIAAIEDFIDPLWQVSRPSVPILARRYQDWSESVLARAGATGVGRSIRQVERRTKQWVGLHMRQLRGLSRAERAFFQSLTAVAQGVRPRWADLAETSGYADQSHLCRETRRITGFAPNELYRRIFEDEAFWSYRLWR